MNQEEKYNGISSEAVKAKTGKGWTDWIKVLDKEKANKLPGNEIAELLYKKYKVPMWWCQMVKVGYEQAKGLRVANQKFDGDFSVDISKVIKTPLAKLYLAVSDDTQRKKWLKEKVEVRKANENKSIRANFDGGSANLAIMFYDKGKGKTQIVITQSKLDDGNHVEKAKAFWKSAVEKLEKVAG